MEDNSKIGLTSATHIIGDVNIPANAVLEISDGTTLITGHTTCRGTIHVKGGRIITQGGCDCDDCNINWEPGTYSKVADFNLDGTVDFRDFGAFADAWLWPRQ